MRTYDFRNYCTTELPLDVRFKQDPLYQWIHRHNCIELMYVSSGVGWCSINGLHYPMMTGDLYVIGELDTHEFSGQRGICYFNIMFDKTLFKEEELELYKALFDDHDEKNVLRPKYTFGAGMNQTILHMLNHIREELNSRKEFHLLRAKSLFLDFLIFIYRNAGRPKLFSVGAGHLELSQMIEYISQHYSSRILAEELAECTGYSAEYLSRMFKKAVGICLSKYILYYRVERACWELLNTEKSIVEIAGDTGFYDTSYFTKVFKNICGITPGRYRSIHEKNPASESLYFPA